VYTFLWEGSRVEKYNAMGDFIMKWEINAWRVTHGAWVGSEYNQLILTSAKSDDGSQRWPGGEAGALFWLKDVNIQGLGLYQFDG